MGEASNQNVIQSISNILCKHDIIIACIRMIRQVYWGDPMIRHIGMCCQNGLLFHQKSLDMAHMGPKYGQKIFRGSHFTKIAQKKKKKKKNQTNKQTNTLVNQPFLSSKNPEKWALIAKILKKKKS